MDTLRWILLIIGLLILAGIYWWGRRSEGGQHGRKAKEDHREPRFDQDSAENEVDWIDDVRPVRRSLHQGLSQDVTNTDRELEPRLDTPMFENDEHEPAPVSIGDDAKIPALAGEEKKLHFCEMKEESQVPRAVPEKTVFSPNEPQPPSFGLETTNNDEWIDDVRPLKRSQKELEERASKIRLDDIPKAVAEKLGTAEEIASRDEAPEPVDVLIMHLVPAKKDEMFSGDALAAAFDFFGLRFTPKGTFIREAGAGEPMFSVVNRLKPGTFESAGFANVKTPGISFFLRLPGPDQPMVAFRAMIDCARKMGARLNGRLLDEYGQPMTPQTFSQYEKRVRIFVSGLYKRLEKASSCPDATGIMSMPERQTKQQESGKPPTLSLDAGAKSVVESSPFGIKEHAKPRFDDENVSGRPEKEELSWLERYENRVRSFVAGLKRKSRDEPLESYEPMSHVDVEDDDILLRSSSESRTVPFSKPVFNEVEAENALPAAKLSHTEEETEDDFPSATSDMRSHESANTSSAHKNAKAPEELLIIHVVANSESDGIEGDALARAFESCDLRFNDMHIFQRDAVSGEPLFQVVNMIKPGTFDPGAFDTLITPGVSLFMQLPGPEQPMLAFRKMSECARRLAQTLDGHLEDDTHSAMTTQTLGFYEERVRHFIQRQARERGGRR